MDLMEKISEMKSRIERRKTSGMTEEGAKTAFIALLAGAER